MATQLSLLPLMHQFDKKGFITDTTYFEMDACKEDDCYVVFNKDYYTMFIPDGKWDWLGEIIEAETAVITRGSYNGKDDYFEIMFLDENKPPYMIMIPGERFERVSPLKEGWHGHLHIYAGSMYDCKNWFDKVYYRIADTLPCDKPVEE